MVCDARRRRCSADCSALVTAAAVVLIDVFELHSQLAALPVVPANVLERPPLCVPREVAASLPGGACSIATVDASHCGYVKAAAAAAGPCIAAPLLHTRFLASTCSGATATRAFAVMDDVIMSAVQGWRGVSADAVVAVPSALSSHVAVAVDAGVQLFARPAAAAKRQPRSLRLPTSRRDVPAGQK